MRMKTARIGDCIVGDGHPCFISLEAGATHTGLQSALELVRAAADAGADAVKFQTILADELMADEDFEIAFESASGKSQESVYNALKRRELTLEEWAEVKAFCDRRGLLFISTPSGFETVDWLKKLGAAAIKVSKSDINHRVLIEYIAQQGLPVILDGRERFEDVETAARICEDAGVEDIVVMHCPSGYPAERAGIHLSAVTIAILIIVWVVNTQVTAKAVLNQQFMQAITITIHPTQCFFCWLQQMGELINRA